MALSNFFFFFQSLWKRNKVQIHRGTYVKGGREHQASRGRNEVAWGGQPTPP